MPEEFIFNQSQLDFDKQNIWHPYTSLVNPLPVYPVVSAHGVRLKLDSGQELIDGMSSWWTAIHGYNVPELNEVAKQQLSRMSHVMFGGITHQPAIQLAKKLVEITPQDLEKVFFSDSGSVSVEVAMKMALQCQHSRGETKKTKFMTFKRGYHGDTAGAMSVGDPENGLHRLFADFLPKHFFVASPKTAFDGTPEVDEIEQLEFFFQKHAEVSAAFILEPIVQGAGGMRIYSPKYLVRVKELCEEYDLLLIADEIATGFGRTGKLFACEHANISPDIMCVGKALTGGYLSLAATLCTTNVAETICNGQTGVFMHGPTFMGNPLACAIAIKSIELLLLSDWQKKVKQIEMQLTTELGRSKKLSSVKDVRVIGAIGVIETKEQVDVAQAQRFFVEKGVWIRPFRNLIYIMPPYVITETALSRITKAMVDYCQWNLHSG